MNPGLSLGNKGFSSTHFPLKTSNISKKNQPNKKTPWAHTQKNLNVNLCSESIAPNLLPRRNALLCAFLFQIQIYYSKKKPQSNKPPSLKVHSLMSTSVKRVTHFLHKCNTAKSADFNYVFSLYDINLVLKYVGMSLPTIP